MSLAKQIFSGAAHEPAIETDPVFESIFNIANDAVIDEEFVQESELNEEESQELYKEILEASVLAAEYVVLESALEGTEDVIIGKLPVVLETAFDVIAEEILESVDSEYMEELSLADARARLSSLRSGLGTRLSAAKEKARAKLQDIKSKLAGKVSALKSRIKSSQRLQSLAQKISAAKEKVKSKAKDIKRRVRLALAVAKNPEMIRRTAQAAKKVGMEHGYTMGMVRGATGALNALGKSVTEHKKRGALQSLGIFTR